MGIDTAANFVPFDTWHLADTEASGGARPNPIQLGTTRYDYTASGPKKYIWAQVAQSMTNSAFAVNEVAVLASASVLEMTNDISDSPTDSNGGAHGGCRANSACPASTSTKTYYAWFQIGGFATIKTNGDNDMVAGDYFFPSGDGTCNGDVDSDTDSTNALLRNIFARAVGTEASAACAVWLTCTDYAGF